LNQPQLRRIASRLTVLGESNEIEFLAFLGIRDVGREVWILSSATARTREGWTHGKSVKIGPPPDTQAFSNLPIAMSGFSITSIFVGYPKTFIESGQKTFLVGLAWIEVSSGTVVSAFGEGLTYSL
jgi:hypothetical protein